LSSAIQNWWKRAWTYWLSQPTLCAVFSPANPAEVRNALRIVARFIPINVEPFSLVESIHESEARHAGTSCNRTESSLQTA
jgi:hypothetical protein